MKKRKPAAGKVALLLVDFINPLDFHGAARLRKRALEAASNAAKLRARARGAGIPCIYVNDNYGEWALPFERIVDKVEAKNKDAAKLVDLLRPEPGDIAVLKPRHSGFYGTPLEFLLGDLGARRLIVTGLSTDRCVLATAQDAHIRRFQVWVPANCVAAEKGTEEPAVLRQIARTLDASVDPFTGKLWP
jgi:nicotinamidase-related amidase